ncbi:MAG: hypothetical protein A2X61_13660 [Ignavibacteria bacterium GWB2_35_12]|nr:MAG: hypothetical protein A2X61_13660 [Ignavibacteria bacterium GWB2_35_12]OGU95195.1 MAG: hypothetical protein A2220_00255 [Ignavibacteria bacterium RIFOXYA2_FULL_35_10]OGV24513.1 MAG: hypothetical protein A2475_15520 [Ignavibacteria bacterium RIFOXYC2_FULL_35_21]
MKKGQILIGIIIIASLFIGLFLGRNCTDKVRIVKDREVIRDTVIKEIKLPPVRIVKAKPVIKIIRDTVIETKPFVASLDTIAKDDTVKMQYEFPENYFSLEVMRKPDSVKFEKLTVIEKTTQDGNWWEKPSYFTGGALIGIIIGLIISK